MSLFGDIWSFIGQNSIPLIFAGATFTAFEFLEKISSDDAKAALARLLKGTDVHATAVLPEGTCELFDRIFSDRHFLADV